MTRFLPAVAGNADGIPEGGGILPLVNQAGRFAFQQERRFGNGGGQVFITFVSILQFNDTGCLLLCRGGFSAPFGTFYIDGSEGIQVVLQLVINDSFQVVHNRGA